MSGPDKDAASAPGQPVRDLALMPSSACSASMVRPLPVHVLADDGALGGEPEAGHGLLVGRDTNVGDDGASGGGLAGLGRGPEGSARWQTSHIRGSPRSASLQARGLFCNLNLASG